MDDIEVFDLQKIKSTLVGKADQIDTKTVMIGILNTLLHLNEKIEKIETDVKKIEDINTKMSSVVARVQEHEELLNDIQINSKVIEEIVESIGKIVNTALNHCNRNKDSIENIEDRLLAIETEDRSEHKEKETIKQMQDAITDLKCRSMRNNLVFSGLHFQQNEICKVEIQNFLEAELGINDRVSFGNVHRFGKPGLNGFPPEIENKRKELYPVMKKAKVEGKRVKLVQDKLYINGKPYNNTTASNKQATEYRDVLLNNKSSLTINGSPPILPRRFKRSRNDYVGDENEKSTLSTHM
ncbi:unnamed protein product [Mytilus coruscus]|uniref:Uncharacterized protein n=1 Tax=Mytilus coruscus TaxID=42192 RepID=A0A6J7ZYT6_MYTCO|nr:unnamed protein product [Mytilus coruscus]